MILLIDTSTMLGLCAIAKKSSSGDYKVLYEKHISAELSHSEKLFIGIKDALNTCGVNFDSVKKVVYCSGPGSFTGLRISYSAVKGFFVAKGFEPFGVSTLKALLKSYNSTDSSVLCAIMASGKQEFFAYAVDVDGHKQRIKEDCYTQEELLKLLFDLKKEGVVCIGQGALAIKDKLTEMGIVVPDKAQDHIVNARGMLCLLEDDRVDGINYLKASYAEQRRKN